MTDEQKAQARENIGAISVESANAYTDKAVAQKSTVQIVTWEADD